MPVQNVSTPSATGFRPLEAKWADAAALKTALASCEVRLFVTNEVDLPNPLTRAAMDELEATYSGYTAGGVTVTAAGDPYLDANGDVCVTLPLVQFNQVPGAPNVANVVRGAYVVDAANVLRGVFTFPAQVLMETIYDAIPVVATFKVL